MGGSVRVAVAAPPDHRGRRIRLTVFALAGLLCVACAASPAAPTAASATPTTATATTLAAGATQLTSTDRLSPQYPVISIADGDTITVDVDGVDERIRLIGIDAPELKNPPECFGPEAAKYATDLLAGKSVLAVRLPLITQDGRDRG